MKFKSRTALAEHFKELEKNGYVISSVISEPFFKNGKNGWKHIRVFKINFDNVKRPIKEQSRSNFNV